MNVPEKVEELIKEFSYSRILLQGLNGPHQKVLEFILEHKDEIAKYETYGFYGTIYVTYAKQEVWFSYSGQTHRTVKRTIEWGCLERKYAGKKLNEKREEIGPDGFCRAIVFEIFDVDGEVVQAKLNEVEIYSINKLDSYRNGLNSSRGGGSYIYRKKEKTELLIFPLLKSITVFPKKDKEEKKDPVYVYLLDPKNWRTLGRGGIFKEIDINLINDYNVIDEINRCINNPRHSIAELDIEYNGEKLKGFYNIYSEDTMNDIVTFSSFGLSKHTVFTDSNYRSFNYNSICCIHVERIDGVDHVTRYDSMYAASLDSWYSYSTIRNWVKEGVWGYMMYSEYRKKVLEDNYQIYI